MIPPSNIHKFPLRFFIILILLLSIFWPLSAYGQKKPSSPKYVFLFIGDGTSFPQRSAAEYYQSNSATAGKPDIAGLRVENTVFKNISSVKLKRLVMNTFPAQGISTTYSASSLVTDSAASATAIATGHKTRDGVIGMDIKAKKKLTSIAKIAKKKGRKVGIITSVSIDHATPAAFYANQPSRSSYYEIAAQAPKSGFDYFAGGGFKQPKGAGGNKKDIFVLLSENGYKITRDRADFGSLSAASGKVVAINPVLDAESALPYSVDRSGNEITLAEFVEKGIELLDNDAGFFMMVEGGKIDWACHANDAISAITDVIDLDKAVETAYEFYNKHPADTLIIVTGDHETGGMTVGLAGARNDNFVARISKQKGSYMAFNKLLFEMKREDPELTLEKLAPIIENFFGLHLYSDDEIKKLQAASAAGDVAAAEKLAYALLPFEVESIKKGLSNTLLPVGSRPGQYRNYGMEYEPLTISLTHVLNNKAGIGWTTFSHSGIPTPVSAVGIGQEHFIGYYDNTDIFKKIVDIAY